VKTYAVRKQDIEHKWYVVDAEGQVLGRLASQVAHVLKGKHKPIYSPHLDTGDHVVVVNADKVVLTGKKLEQKVYHRHTGYPSGLKSITAKKLMQQKPETVVRRAVQGMLPKNSLGRQMLKKLKVYAGPEHPHPAQQPIALELAYKKR
jgi:large subunit ribosomal protein L13